MSSHDRSEQQQHARRLTRRARLYLIWERYAPVLAPAAAIIFIFIAASMFGLWQRLGDPWRIIALAATIGVTVWSVWRAKGVAVPSRSDAMRRTEIDNELRHRPFDTIHDEPAINADVAIWNAHLAAALEKVSKARAATPRPALAPLDQYYLRFILPVMAMLAMAVGAGDNYERLRASLAPSWVSGVSAKDASFEAWIVPPDYTGRPPTYFKDSRSVKVPDGSEFVARISGVKTAPRLIARKVRGSVRISPKRLGPKSHEARIIVTENLSAEFRIQTRSEKWTLDLVKDAAPTVRFDKEPEAAKRDRLIFSFSAEDDYGLESAALVFSLRDAPDLPDRVAISLPGRGTKTVTEEPASLDLTKHKWAGKEVSGFIEIIDGKGQVGRSKSADFIVPDKIFVEPLAKAVAEQRQLVLAGMRPYAPAPHGEKTENENSPLYSGMDPAFTIDRAPAQVRRAALMIDIVTDRPDKTFSDPVIYLGLRRTYHRLRSARSAEELGGVPEDLWALAMRAEFGVLGDAKEDMIRAEKALSRAMARRAPQREVDTLFERYNEAVDRYMEELTKKAIEDAKKNQAAGNQGGGEEGMQLDQIQELMDAIEEANRKGDTQAARRALARLAELLENLQIQMAQGGEGSGEGLSDGMSEELKEALEELADVLGEQRQLRDETMSSAREETDREFGDDTQGRSQDGEGEGDGRDGQSQPNGKSAEELAEMQDQLQSLLDKVERPGTSGEAEEDGQSAGEPSDEGSENGAGGLALDEDTLEALREAGRAMDDAEEKLRSGDLYSAGRDQSKAIDALRKAGEGLIAEEARRLAEENGQGEDGASGDQASGGEGTDPLGRENDGSGVDDSVEVPDMDDRERAYQLLEELRRRAGEQERSQTERDYLQRLLDRF